MVLGAELLALLVGTFHPQNGCFPCHLANFLPKEKAVKKIVKSTGKAGCPNILTAEEGKRHRFGYCCQMVSISSCLTVRC